MRLYNMIVASKILGGGGVTPTGTINITQNGDADVTDYATAHVAVPQPSGSISITQNGTVDVTQYASADVNVSGGGGDDFKKLIDRSITSIDIPSGVTKIGEQAFSLCTSLITVKIPESVTKIDSYAFANCVKLQTVTIEAVTPPQLAASSFNSTSALQHIYVPAESVDAYKAASNWSNKASKISAIPSA